jgi:oxygen-independent coproporphyrinogen-3 oxidase
VNGVESNAAGLTAPRLPAHLYVHVPFCASKCGYCDFASVAGADETTVRIVFRSIRSQLLQWERSGLEGVLETVYFGGGTPSLVAGEVVDLLDFVREHFLVHAAAEVTVEANPDSLGREAVASFAGAGVTRVSVGVQSFVDHELRVLGRVHDAAQAAAACERVRNSGLALSVDLMCGVPGQSRASWASTLQRTADSGAEHVSVYPLAIEDGTPMQVAVDTGLLEEPDPDVAAEHLILAESALRYHGFERYEVANYCRDAQSRARHNAAYWTGRSYIGVGPGAHGMVDAETARQSRLFGDVPPAAARVRFASAGDIGEWLVGTRESVETLTYQEAAREDAMLGMRMTEGITDDLARRAGVTDVLESLRRDGLVQREGSRWRVTQRGWLLGNEVFGRLWTAD